MASRDLQARPGVLRAAGGFTLVELVVAAACAGLLGAAVLSLALGVLDTARERAAALEARATAEAAVAALAGALREAGAGLEGARTLRMRGESIPVLRLDGTGLTAVLSNRSPVEVESLPGGGYRTESLAGFEIGGTVVGLGLEGPMGAPVPAGLVVAIERDRGRGRTGGSLWVNWAAPEREVIAAGGGVRALAPVRARQIETVRRAGALQLRRRDDASRWQPVVDGVAELELARRLHSVYVRVRVEVPFADREVAAVAGVEVRALADEGEAAP